MKPVKLSAEADCTQLDLDDSELIVQGGLPALEGWTACAGRTGTGIRLCLICCDTVDPSPVTAAY